MASRFNIRQSKVQVLSSEELEKILDSYEKKYRMDSRDFYRRYNTGALEENPDFTDWASFYDMAAKVGIDKARVEA